MRGNLSHRQKAIASAQRTYQGPTPKVLNHDPVTCSIDWVSTGDGLRDARRGGVSELIGLRWERPSSIETAVARWEAALPVRINPRRDARRDGQVRSVFMLEAGIRSPEDEVPDPDSHSAFNGGTALPFLRRGICVSMRRVFAGRVRGASLGGSVIILAHLRLTVLSSLERPLPARQVRQG